MSNEKIKTQSPNTGFFFDTLQAISEREEQPALPKSIQNKIAGDVEQTITGQALADVKKGDYVFRGFVRSIFSRQQVEYSLQEVTKVTETKITINTGVDLSFSRATGLITDFETFGVDPGWIIANPN